MNPPLELWLVAFALTCAIELPVVLLPLRGRLPWERALAGAFGAQLLTHPALWYLLPRFSPWWAWVSVAEAGVFTVEAVLYTLMLVSAGRPAREAVLWGSLTATVANGLSLGLGLAMSAMGWL